MRKSFNLYILSILLISTSVYCALPNYAEVLHKSYLFYHAQKSGILNGKRRLAWRNDSCFDCKGPGGEDLSGGFYEAANTMKWGLPYSFVVFQLAHNLLSWREAHIRVNEYGEGLNILKWASDWLINAHPSPNVFHGQVGSSDVDFDYFGPPEEYETWATKNKLPTHKPVYTLTTTDPGSEIVGQASAALATTALVFQAIDPAYSALCIKHAKELFDFGRLFPRSFMNSTQAGYLDHKDWYPSNDFNDELVLAASTLYLATRDVAYLSYAETLYQECCFFGGYAYDWDEKIPILHLILYEITNKSMYLNNSMQFYNEWRATVPHTPRGLAYRFYWGSNRYAANAAYIFFLYARILLKLNPNDAFGKQVFDYAASQIDYIVGANGQRSWVVGYGNDYPKLPYHKSSYNPYLEFPLRNATINEQRDDFYNSTRANTFILYGAVVGGPFLNDSWVDNRNSYEYTEVTIDYNAGFTGAVAALVDKYGGLPFSDAGLDLGWNHPNANKTNTNPTRTNTDPTSITDTIGGTKPSQVSFASGLEYSIFSFVVYTVLCWM